MAIISTVFGKSFASTLREARERTEDPSTGRAYTQVRLGELLGVSDSLVSKWEHGEGVPSPELVNEIARYLNVTVRELAEAMGFHLEPDALRSEERDLLAAFRRLSPGLQETALRVVKALPESPLSLCLWHAPSKRIIRHMGSGGWYERNGRLLGYGILAGLVLGGIARALDAVF